MLKFVVLSKQRDNIPKIRYYSAINFMPPPAPFLQNKTKKFVKKYFLTFKFFIFFKLPFYLFILAAWILYIYSPAS